MDLFISNHVVSELIDQGPVNALTDTYRLLSERSKEDALFLLIDRRESRILRTIDDIVDASGLCQIEPPIEWVTYIDLDEQKSDLGDWLENLDWTPKVTFAAKLILAAKKTSVRFDSDDDIPF